MRDARFGLCATATAATKESHLPGPASGALLKKEVFSSWGRNRAVKISQSHYLFPGPLILPLVTLVKTFLHPQSRSGQREGERGLFVSGLSVAQE